MNHSDNHRILVVSHAHPDFSLGGGEIAAYNIYKEYKINEKVQSAWFLGRIDRGRGATGRISMRRENEFLWEQGINDWHKMKAANQESLLTWFSDLIKVLKPTVVHAHHYAHLGLEYLRIIKRLNPLIRIFLTLHEYMGICSNHGQMVKVKDHRLCSGATYDECHQCFPEKSAEDFWLREHFIKSHFSFVDHFVAPSEFLRQRYIQWGIPAEKITMIENGQHIVDPVSARTLGDGETRNRFGYFGQINPFKGVDLLLKAIHSMSKKDRKKIVLEIHGSNLDLQAPEWKSQFMTLLEPLVKKGVVRWIGPYRPDELASRMAHVDWVLMPSIWWENSPLVIQEAFMIGRPVIGSDIGGMKEKIRHGIDGIHVPVSNFSAWADTILKVRKYTNEWDVLQSGIRRPVSWRESSLLHLSLFSFQQRSMTK